ncbi:hypothetical protein V496_09397 [Pseudogymnoascus sp. VKM F-4515 (FW-2607)]|nr:hypothetical protein V496_09397 [Pseudogymnoascus sp. VKM F-4515 (FW-2607)]KFY98755.1 hypothetical protein V498_01261 [Pseudogymnoascus sp. VKM F-4517 (FW-2822)]
MNSPLLHCTALRPSPLAAAHRPSARRRGGLGGNARTALRRNTFYAVSRFTAAARGGRGLRIYSTELGGDETAVAVAGVLLRPSPVSASGSELEGTP